MLTTTLDTETTAPAAREDLERRKAESRAWYDEGMEGWRDYQETGLHITLDELGAWMKTWGTDNETDPEFHT